MNTIATPEFRALLEAAPDAMIIVDQAGRIALVNSQAEGLFGHPRDELLGQPIERLIPERFRASHPSHRTLYATEPRTRPMGATGIELYALRKDGTEFPAEVSLSPLRLNGDTLTIAAIRDGTPRRRVEEKFRRLLEAAPDAMVITGSDGRIQLVNAQAETLFGYARGELLGQPVELLIPERYRAAHPAHRRGYFHGPRIRPMGAGGLALFGRRKDGTEFPAEISLSPLETEEGLVAITAIRDITERKKAEAERATLYQAQEAIRMRDEFLSIASHELKTPITALQIQVESVLRALQKGPDLDQLGRMVRRLDVVRHAVVRLNTLLNQLLDLSRITAGRLKLEPQEVDLGALVRQTVNQLRDELEQSGCEVRLHIPETPLPGFWDPLRVEQIVTNLLTNAMKYGQGKPIEISVDGHDTTAYLSVRDHGIGIAPEHQARIFERFERILSDRNVGGFGLGLWIVRQIIEAHGGIIRVWSQPGAGSTFTVELPRGLGASAQSGGAPAPTQEEHCLMLVDDDVLIRDSFVNAIEDEGYRVVTAQDGAEALRILRQGVRPCLIFLDLMMPVMDGGAFRSEQQRDPQFGEIPVVVLSAAGNVDKQAEALGVTTYLRKPMDLDSVFNVIKRYC